MKKTKQDLTSIFAVAEEMVKGNGEDCYYYEAKDNRFIIASFDGLGGSGAKKYGNYSGKSGAYMASRSVQGGVQEWFRNSGKDSEMMDYVTRALSVCKALAGESGVRILGSLSKSFPTTAAIVSGSTTNNGIDATCFWAGDSRVYLLDASGMHQLTDDDIEDQDAMSNLINDAVMTNVINATSDFDIHTKKLALPYPCILLAATDGCFGYLPSPMDFEYLITATLLNSESMEAWKEHIYESIGKVTGDDFTLTVAVCGFYDFNSIKKHYIQRCKYLYTTYLGEDNNSVDMWNLYKDEYSKYLEVK